LHQYRRTNSREAVSTVRDPHLTGAFILEPIF
jgi:hypothetical protein